MNFLYTQAVHANRQLLLFQLKQRPFWPDANTKMLAPRHEESSMQYKTKHTAGRADFASLGNAGKALLLGIVLGTAIVSGCSRSSPASGDSSSGGSAGSSGDAIHVLSNRADLISGNDALVSVVPPAGASSGAKMSVNGKDVTSAFALQTDGSY